MLRADWLGELSECARGQPDLSNRDLTAARAEVTMSDEWDFYFANVNDALASLFVDLGIRDSVPDRDRPWLLWTAVRFQRSRDDGLSSSEEAPLLHEIEDVLTSAVKNAVKAEFVGRITTAGESFTSTDMLVAWSPKLSCWDGREPVQSADSGPCAGISASRLP